MKVGLFGGSFDPIHNGHIKMIEGALKKVDKIIVIPAARNAFKQGRILNPAPYRYYMTCDALERFGDRVIVSDIEFSLPGISYTVNTVRALLSGKLRELCGCDPKLYWICGSDILPTFDQWRDPEELLKMVTLLVAKRPGQDETFKADIERLEKQYDTKIQTFRIDGIKASSSDIRRSVVFDDIPKEAAEFIKTNGLFPSVNYLEHVSDKAMQDFYEYSIAIYPTLSRYRLIHTINVAIEAVKYAVIYNGDPDKALIAGVLHDCAKEYPDDQQRTLCLAFADPSFDIEQLWHAPAGALIAMQQFGIKDEEIISAIKFHTTGHPGMTVTEKAVYLADKIEPARTYADLKEVRKVAMEDLDEAVRMSIGVFIEKSKRKGRLIHPLSLAFAKDLGLC